MEQRELTCINCPLGCQLTVTLENGAVAAVAGNGCPRGDRYARDEVCHPVRMLTSTVPVRGGALRRGRDQLINRETGIDVQVAENPLDCVAVGAGAVLDHLDILSDVLDDASRHF